MPTEESIAFEINVFAEDATVEDLDRMTRNLLAELREVRVDSASLASKGSAPEGSKGDPVTVGSLVIEALPAVLPAVVGLVQAWVARGQGRTVKFKGKDFEFEGSPEELQKILATLEKRRRKK